jgi:hypothetical protein
MKCFMAVILIKYCSCNQNEYEMGRECSTYWVNGWKNFVGNLKKYITWKAIVKWKDNIEWVVKKHNGGVSWIDLALDRVGWRVVLNKMSLDVA